MLAEGGRLDQGLGLGEHLAVAAGPQEGVDAELLGVQVQLGQPTGGRSRGLPVLEVGEGVAEPQGQGVGEQVRRPVRLAERQQLAGAGDLGLEPERVHLVGCQAQDVTVR